MRRTIGVKCPFTGKIKLPFPFQTGSSWYAQVPGSRVWYFHNDYVKASALGECIAELISEVMPGQPNPDPVEIRRVVMKMQAEGEIRHIRDWWFVRLPELPKVKVPTLWEVILERDAVNHPHVFFGIVESRFRVYLEGLGKLLTG